MVQALAYITLGAAIVALGLSLNYYLRLKKPKPRLKARAPIIKTVTVLRENRIEYEIPDEYSITVVPNTVVDISLAATTGADGSLVISRRTVGTCGQNDCFLACYAPGQWSKVIFKQGLLVS